MNQPVTRVRLRSRSNGLTAFLVMILLLLAAAGIGLLLDTPAVTQVDAAVGEQLMNLRNSALNEVAGWLNVIGSTTGYAAITLLAAVLFLIRRRTAEAVLTIVSVAGAYGLNTLVKNIVDRARPLEANRLFAEDGFSFPSGNATIAAALIGFIVFALAARAAKRSILQSAVPVIGIALILLIGAFRIYAGVHYFSDIIAGYLLGAAWLAIVVHIHRNYTS